MLVKELKELLDGCASDSPVGVAVGGKWYELYGVNESDNFIPTVTLIVKENPIVGKH